MFCNQCGNQVEESRQYCGNCGASMKQNTPLGQVVETQFNFCRSCGNEAKGRYCAVCGENMIKTEAKVKNSGFTSKQGLKDIGLNPLSVKKINLSEIIKWVKQGLLFAIIVAVIGIGISALIGLGIKETIYGKYFYGSYRNASSFERSVMDTFLNLKLIIYHLFFGGQINLSVTIGGIKEIIGLGLPFLGGIFGVVMMVIGEKIRLKITGYKRTLAGTGIMAVVTGGVMTLLGALLNGSMKYDMKDLYGTYDLDASLSAMKASSSVGLLLTFFSIVALTYFTLQIVMKNKIEDVSKQRMVTTVRRITFAVLGFALVMALSVIGKIFMEAGTLPEGVEWIAFLVVGLYLTGFFVVILVSGQYNMLEVITNSESVLKLKMTLMSVKSDMYGIEDKIDNFMKWWLVIAVIISICIILSITYKFFKGREMNFRTALKESALMSILLGIGFSVVAKMASYTISLSRDVNMRGSNNYYMDEMMDNGKYSLLMQAGDNQLIKSIIIVAVFMCVLLMIAYGLARSGMPIVSAVMKVLHPGVICGAIAVFSIIFLVKFDTYDVNYSILGVIEEASDYIGDEVNENFLDLFDYYW